MKVLLISPSYQPVLGGLQTVTHQVALALMKSGHEVRVVTNRYPRALPGQEFLDGVSVQRWPFFDSLSEAMRRGRMDLALAGAYYNPLTTVRLNRLVASFRPDVVNLHFPEPRLASVLNARRHHAFRLVVSLHGDDIERWFRAGLSDVRPEASQFGVVREMLRSADAVTACSRYLLDRASVLEPSIFGKAMVIHNGVEPSRFLKRDAHRHARPYVFAYGRHTHKKGFDLLLKAFAPVAQRFSEIDLIVAGSGEETEDLRRLRSELGLDQRVVFYGRANPEEVVRLLNGCRLVAIPSREEPFGIVAVEALMSGRPIVATRVGGLPEVAAAVAASCAGDSPRLYWATPDASDLTGALIDGLSEAETFVQRPVTFLGLSVTDMTQAYQRALEGSSESEEESSPSHYAAVS